MKNKKKIYIEYFKLKNQEESMKDAQMLSNVRYFFAFDLFE